MTVKLTLRMTAEDAERLMDALKNGKLSELGVLEVTAIEPETADAPEQKWTNAEGERREAPTNPGVPPRG